MTPRTHVHPRPARGFTLIEVLAALSVMMFLVGGIYGIANGALTLSRSSHEARTAELRLNSLDALLRTAFGKMPAQAKFELRVEGNGAGSELAFRNAPGVLTWSGPFAAADMASLRSEADPQEKGTMRLILEHWISSPEESLRPLGQLVLMEGLVSLQWRLFHPETDQWETLWFPQQGRPLLVELTLRTTGSTEEQRLVFWIPASDPARPRGQASPGVPASKPGDPPTP